MQVFCGCQSSTLPSYSSSYPSSTCGCSVVTAAPVYVYSSYVPDFCTVVKELTGGCRTLWLADCKHIPSADLPSIYSGLFRIAIYNWMPRKHKSNVSKKMALFLYNVGQRRSVDLVEMIFHHILSRAVSHGTTLLPLPCLLIGLVLSQTPISIPDAPVPMETTSLHESLLSGRHNPTAPAAAPLEDKQASPEPTPASIPSGDPLTIACWQLLISHLQSRLHAIDSDRTHLQSPDREFAMMQTFLMEVEHD